MAIVKEIMKSDEGVVRIAGDKNTLAITKTLNMFQTWIVGLLHHRLSTAPIEQLALKTFKFKMSQFTRSEILV